MANKVVFGLKNVHVAFLDETTGEYDAPTAVPGAVDLSLSPKGDSSPFYADDVEYFTSHSNNGYDADINMALVPDAVKAEMLGWRIDENGGVVEIRDATPKPFALLYEIDGDAAKKRYAIYKCTAARPDEKATTKGDKVEPTPTGLKLTAYPIEIDGEEVVHYGLERTTANAAVFDAFFTAVVTPTYASA